MKAAESCHGELPLNVVRFAGHGVPIIMLHGWMHSSENLRPLGELLASPSRPVHIIDLPGFGRSARPPSDWGTDEYAARILRYVDEQGFELVDLFGHSFGGRVSIRMAASSPAKVRNLILMSSHGLKPVTRSKKWLRLKVIAAIRGTVRFVDRYFNTQYYKEKFIPKFASADYLSAGDMLPIFLKTVREDLSDVAPLVKARTLLIWGENDVHTPVELGKRFNELIARSKLVVLEGKGHEPFQAAGAHLCASVIVSFLSEGTGQASA